MKHLKTYKLFESTEDYNQSEQIAHDELFGVKATLAFDFNREFIHDADGIKDLIEKYNEFYIKEKSWSGGPPPRNFIEYFNKNYSKKGNASLSTWYPTIDLIIESKNYGKLILGFSIINKSYKLFNWGGLGIPDAFATGNRDTTFNKNVLSEIGKYVREQLSKMNLEEVIDELNLDVTNYFEWEWKQIFNEKIELGYDVKNGISKFSSQFNPDFIDVVLDICESFDIDGRIEPMDRGLVDDYINSHSSYYIGGMRKGVLSIVIDGGDLSQMKSLVVDLDNVVKDWEYQIYIDIERYGNGGWLYDFMSASDFIELETRFEVTTLTILIYKR